MATDRELWAEVLEADRVLLGRNWSFLQGAADPAATVAASLRTPGETGGALRYLRIAAPDAIKLAVLPQLMFLAVGSNSETPVARSVICSIPDRDPLIAAVRPLAEELLADGDDETYLRIAELYADLSDDLLRDHLARCAAHPDPMVREVPTYFEE